jgi:uncharacterized repeat protein (TIGR03803 family)
LKSRNEIETRAASEPLIQQNTIKQNMIKQKRLHNTVFAAVIVFRMAASIAAAQTSETVIHQFTGADGAAPNGQLLVDSSGNIFGTTQNGGTSTACTSGCGVVFEISPTSGGGWLYRIIHDFQNQPDGANPRTSLSMDSAGNIYGTTVYGGTGAFDCTGGCGTIFMLSPSSNGHWTETVLYRFQSLTDGREPIDGVTIDAHGNLFGVTQFSDNATQYIGEVYELSPSGGKWTFTTLHNFIPNGTDGYYPLAGVVLDAAGNLYGNTQFGGNNSGCYQQGCGVIYELSPSSNGTWTENILYVFENLAGDGGSIPSGRIAMDSAGNIYGTTEYGGYISSNCPAPGCGTLFKLVNNGGTWTRTTLHFFGDNAEDGKNPLGPVTLDSAGNLYGTTQYGGASLAQTLSHGNVYTVPAAGAYMPLHSFNTIAGGEIPWAGVTPDSHGNLWGTTFVGGQDQGDGYGVVFELPASK